MRKYPETQTSLLYAYHARVSSLDRFRDRFYAIDLQKVLLVYHFLNTFFAPFLLDRTFFIFAMYLMNLL